jgi:hypothetical protein
MTRVSPTLISTLPSALGMKPVWIVTGRNASGALPSERTAIRP